MTKIYKASIVFLVIFSVCIYVFCKAGEIPEKEWREYHKKTGKELFQEVVDLFFYKEYKNGGDNKGRLDCNGAFELSLKKNGAKIPDTNAWGHGKLLWKTGFKRQKFEEVEERDVIVFNLIKKRVNNKNTFIGHISQVIKVDKRKKKIYMWEFCKKTNGVNYRGIRFDDQRINGIYFITPTYFYSARK
jgi:hypothetical protein